MLSISNYSAINNFALLHRFKIRDFLIVRQI